MQSNSRKIIVVTILAPLATSLFLYLLYLFFKLVFFVIRAIIQRGRFVKWSKEQKLVLVNGGVLSGKQTLLTFVSNSARKRKNKEKTSVRRSVSFLQEGVLYDIEDQRLRKDYSKYFEENGEKKIFLISEQSNPRKITSDECTQEVIESLEKLSFFNVSIWISFWTSESLLSKQILTRANSRIRCRGISNFLYFFKIIRMTINDGSERESDYDLIVWKSETIKTAEFWEAKNKLNKVS